MRAQLESQQRQDWLGVKLGGTEAETTIVEVLPASAAKKVGLKSGDRIEALDGVDINTKEQIIAVIAQRQLGDEMEIRIQRDGEMLEFPTTLGKRWTQRRLKTPLDKQSFATNATWASIPTT